jgi:hypothetical protein
MKFSTRTTLFLLLTLLQIGSNITILASTSLHLFTDTSPKVCLVGLSVINKVNPIMFCELLYITAGLGIGINIIIYVFQEIDHLITNSFKGLLITLLASLYAASAAVVTYASHNDDDLNMPQSEWKTAVWALIWVNLGLTLMMSAVSTAFSEKKVRTEILSNVLA